MKYLFKNSFFSFFKNKVAIILMMIIILLTSLSFTMFNSSHSAFKSSYETVMKKGNVHQYTIKELYNIEGDVLFTDPVLDNNAKSKQKTIYEPKNQLDKITDLKNPKIVLYQNSPYLSLPLKIDIEQYGVKSSQNLLVFIGLDEYLLNQQINGQQPKKKFKVIIPINNNSIKSPSSTSKEFENQGFTSHVVNVAPNGSSIKWIQTIGLSGNTFSFSNPLSQVYQTINKSFNNLVNKKTISLDKYNMPLDKSSGQVFKDISDKNNYSFWVEKNQQASTKLNLSEDKIYDIEYKTQDQPQSVNKLREIIYQDLWNNAQNNMHQKMLKYLDDQKKIDYKDVKSIKVSYKNKNYKIVQNLQSNVDKLKIYEGSNVSKKLTYNQLLTKLNKIIDESDVPYTKNIFKDLILNPSNIIKKEYSLSVSYSGIGGSTLVAKDPSSMEAIISPSYAKENKIKPISQKDFDKIINDPKIYKLWNSHNSDYLEFKNALIKKTKDFGLEESLIFLGQTPYFVKGIGITPDFSFPIISQDKPLPDVKNEAILYVNKAGYQRIKDANKTADSENYIAFSVHKSVSEDDKKDLINNIKQYSQNQTSWPQGISALSSYNDPNERFLLTPSRITFLENMNNNISNISYIVTSLLVLFTAFIVIIVVKKQIDNRKRQLGILLANGYSKAQIASSMMVVGAIVSIIPATVGYIVGHFMQFALMEIFSNYWTLPIWKTQFSWITLVITFIIPLISISFLAFAISLISMKGKIPEILNDVSIKTGTLAKYAMKPFGYIGIKVKMAGSIIFSNVGKLLIAFIGFAGTIIALSISITSVGRFDKAMISSQAGSSYEYKVDLISPTNEAGLYSAKNINDIFYETETVPRSKIEVINESNVRKALADSTKKDHYDDHIIFHSPIPKDGEWSGASPLNDFYPYYLKNRIQIKSLLDTNLIGKTNPWNIAAQMMPENQRNKAELASSEFINWAAKEYKIDQPGLFDSLIKGSILIKENNKYKISRENNSDTINLKPEYINFIAYGLAKSVNKFLQGNRKTPLPYFMSYNNLIKDKDDELYTYIETTFNHKNFRNKIQSRKLKIRGINLDRLEHNKSMVNLSQNSIKSLINKSPSRNNNKVPIVINKLFAKYNNVSIGKTFTLDIDNSTSRYIDIKKAKRTFEIVGIENTFDGDRVYTLQKYANEVIGLKNLQNIKNNSLIEDGNYFNGIMTKHKDPLIFRTMSLYSPSSLYLGKNNLTNTVKNSVEFKVVKNSFFIPNKSFKSINPRVGKIDDLFNIYGDGTTMQPMNAMVNDVAWSTISNYQFDSISKLSASLMNTIQTITIFITLAFVVLIATMIINDNKKFISTLKVIGYRSREISRIFLATFIPSLIAAIALAIPTTILVLSLVQNGVMGFGNILVPLNMAGWEIPLSIILLIIGFLTIYWLSSRSLKNVSLLQAFNE